MCRLWQGGGRENAMKVREGFVLRKVADQYVVVAIGPASRILNGMIKLNETGAFCWDYLLKGISENELGGGGLF